MAPNDSGELIGPNGERRSKDPVEAQMQTMRIATGATDSGERPARSVRLEVAGDKDEVEVGAAPLSGFAEGCEKVE